MKEERTSASSSRFIFQSTTYMYIYIYIIKREAQAPRLHVSVNCLLESTATLLLIREYCYITCCNTAAFESAGASTSRLFYFILFQSTTYTSVSYSTLLNTT